MLRRALLWVECSVVILKFLITAEEDILSIALVCLHGLWKGSCIYHRNPKPWLGRRRQGRPVHALGALPTCPCPQKPRCGRVTMMCLQPRWALDLPLPHNWQRSLPKSWRGHCLITAPSATSEREEASPTAGTPALEVRQHPPWHPGVRCPVCESASC